MAGAVLQVGEQGGARGVGARARVSRVSQSQLKATAEGPKRCKGPVPTLQGPLGTCVPAAGTRVFMFAFLRMRHRSCGRA